VPLYDHASVMGWEKKKHCVASVSTWNGHGARAAGPITAVLAVPASRRTARIALVMTVCKERAAIVLASALVIPIWLARRPVRADTTPHSRSTPTLVTQPRSKFPEILARSPGDWDTPTSSCEALWSARLAPIEFLHRLRRIKVSPLVV
jgi:hypothetical protein